MHTQTLQGFLFVIDLFCICLATRSCTTLISWTQDDPLVLLCAELGKELGVKGEQILLSHRTVTLSTTASPASLGLSTVDIIGMYIPS